MDKLAELREKLAEFVNRQSEILALSEEEKRDITDEEETEFNELDTKIAETEDEIRKEEERLERQKKVDERKEALKKAQRSDVPIYTGRHVVVGDLDEFKNYFKTMPYNDIADRPLLLTQILFLYKRYGYLPEQPSMIYKKLIMFVLRHMYQLLVMLLVVLLVKFIFQEIQTQ